MSAVGNQFKVFINGNYEGRYFDDSTSLTKGNFAFLGYQDSGTTTCTFDKTWVWVYK